MARLIVTRGLPGSGKTTRARRWVAENVDRRVRVNRDDTRAMFHGGRLGTPTQEHQVTVLRNAAVVALLAEGYDVVCDDTTLSHRHLREFYRLGASVRAEVVVWDMRDVPVEVCIERDARRAGAARVGERVIRELWRQHIAGREVAV